MSSRRGWWSGLVLVGLVALVLRLLVIFLPSHFTLSGDPADYNLHAVSIATGHGYPATAIASPDTPSAFRPPAYPYLLGGLYAIAGAHPNAARLLGAGLGLVTVLMIGWLGAELYDRRTGLVAAAVAACCPSLIAVNSTLLSEALFLPVELGVALGVLALLRGRAPLRLAVLTGALCGVAALTRTIGVVWLLPALLAAAAAPAARAIRLRAVAGLLASVVLVILPWTIRNAQTFHALVPLNTQGGFTIVSKYNEVSGRDDRFQAVSRLPPEIPGLVKQVAPLYARPHGVNELQLDGAFTRYAIAYIRRHPGYVAIVAAMDTLRMFDLGRNHRFTTSLAYREMSLPSALWSVTTISIELITLMALGRVVLGAFRRGRPSFRASLVWAIPLLALAGTVPVTGTVRYRLPLDPFLILLAAAGLVEVGRRLRTSFPAERGRSPAVGSGPASAAGPEGAPAGAACSGSCTYSRWPRVAGAGRS